MRKTAKYLGLVAILILSVSCWKNMSTDELEGEERLQLQQFLKQNDTLNFVPTTSGMYYHDVKTGTGIKPAVYDTAYVFYTIKLLDGALLESNAGTADTLIFPVGQDYVLAGIDEGVTYMRVGGETLFVIPSSLAYGADGSYGIPGYTPILVNVNLLKVKTSGK